ncbi:MAG: ComEC/Rec2 family competence protein [Luteolibacter sp.]
MRVALRRFWAKRPLFVLAAGLVVLLAAYSMGPKTWLPIYILAYAWGICWLAEGGLRFRIFVALLGVVVLLGARWRDITQADDEARFAAMGLRQVEGRLIEDAAGGNGRWSAVTRLHGGQYHGKKVNWVGAGEPPPAGTELRAPGVFGGLEGARNPGGRDRAAILRQQGVVAVFSADEMMSESWIGPYSAAAAKVKRGFHEAIVSGLDENGRAAKVIRAVVIGERSEDSLGLVRGFRESGTLHVFTVSGMHVMMLGSMVWFTLKWTGLPRRFAIPLIIAAMFGYVWITGNGPAAMRAAWMGTVFLGAFALRRRTDLLNALGAVLLVSLVWDPRMIRTPGVQLSYGVVAAIGLGTASMRWCFSWLAKEEEFLPDSEMGTVRRIWLSFRRKVAEALSVSAAASVGSAPLAAYHFGVVAPISVVATVVLVPIVYVMLGLALVSALLNPFWENGSRALNSINSYAAKGCAETSLFFAGLPGSSLPAAFPKADKLIIYDLEYGASAACFAPSTGNAVLIDTGGEFSLESEIGDSLMRLGIRPDSAIFTHSDAGHIASPELLLEMFGMRQVASGMIPAPGSMARKWEEDTKGISFLSPKKGDRLDLGNGAYAEILLSPHDESVGSLADDRALVFMMHWRDWKILWLSDAGRLSEQAMLESGVDLKADAIVAGLHESDISLTENFVRKVDPEVIVIPRRAGIQMDGFRGRQRRLWEKAGVKTIDQALTGGLTVSIDLWGNLEFEGFVDGSELSLSRD